MDEGRARYFLEEMRRARAHALRDAEGFMEVVRVLERLGEYVHGRPGNGLGDFKEALKGIAERSPLAVEIPRSFPALHIPFEQLFHLVVLGRNEATHQGAFARHLTQNAVQLALILEDALMTELLCARDVMVADPVQAMPWQPISFARQKMLMNSFSFLPLFWIDGSWRLLSDRSLGSYLHSPSDNPKKGKVRRDRLHKTVEVAASSGELALEDARTCYPTDLVQEIALEICDTPILVLEHSGSDHLAGIITAFDLL